MGRLAIIVMMGLAVSGCSNIGILSHKYDPMFDGIRFGGKAKSQDANTERQHFVSTVKPVSKSFDGAREAAEYKGIRHCIEYFGTSEIDWEVGPDTDPAALVVENDSLTYMGTCRDA